MSLGGVSWSALEPPVLPADLIALSSGYRSPAGLGKHPLHPLAYAVCTPGARNIRSNVQNDIAGTVM